MTTQHYQESDAALFTVGLTQEGKVGKLASEYALARISLEGLIEEQDKVTSTFRDFLASNFEPSLKYSDFASNAKREFLKDVDDEQPTEAQWADDNNWYRLFSHILKVGGHENLSDLGGIAGRDPQPGVMF